MTEKRKALSRVLTEIIFIVVGLSAAIGTFSIYNSYTLDNSQINKLTCTDIAIVAGAGQAYATIKNIGTTRINASISSISESGTGTTLTIVQTKSSMLELGKEQIIAAKVNGIKAGTKYSITIVGKSTGKTVTYLIVETIAAP